MYSMEPEHLQGLNSGSSTVSSVRKQMRQSVSETLLVSVLSLSSFCFSLSTTMPSLFMQALSSIASSRTLMVIRPILNMSPSRIMMPCVRSSYAAAGCGVQRVFVVAHDLPDALLVHLLRHVLRVVRRHHPVEPVPVFEFADRLAHARLGHSRAPRSASSARPGRCAAPARRSPANRPSSSSRLCTGSRTARRSLSTRSSSSQ